VNKTVFNSDMSISLPSLIVERHTTSVSVLMNSGDVLSFGSTVFWMLK